MSNKDKEDIYNLDPSSRILVGFADGDSSSTQAQKSDRYHLNLFPFQCVPLCTTPFVLRVCDAMKDDVFMIRIRQLAWKEFCRSRCVTVHGCNE